MKTPAMQKSMYTTAHHEKFGKAPDVEAAICAANAIIHASWMVSNEVEDDRLDVLMQ